ncbi:hypothetical protein P3W45_000794 [Vairimorpha bombi]|jgi:NAD+ kinase
MFLIIKKCKDTDISDLALSEHSYNLQEIEENPIKIDEYSFILILGGDGTILRFLQLYKNVPPIIAVNYGTLGFLTSFSKSDDIKRNIKTTDDTGILNIDKMFTSTRNRLLLNNSLYFLNEAVYTTRKRRLNTFTINIKNKCRDLVLRGDSLLVSTMTGSTAYNHSAHGPTLLSDDMFVINVITPNKNMFRPMVCNIDDELEVKCDDEEDSICVVDGKEYSVSGFSIRYDGNQVRFLSDKKINLNEKGVELMMSK